MSEQPAGLSGWFASWFTKPTEETLTEEELKKAVMSDREKHDSSATLVRTDAESYLDAESRTPDIIPTRLEKKKTRRLKLTNNNLVLSCPIPKKLNQLINFKEKDEFTHMRYTAATCSPDEFSTSGYNLRPKLYKRKTELFIVMTMYNEDEVLFTRTLHGVMKNIAHLCSLKKNKMWGPDGWKNVVVCIVSDGRQAINKNVLDVLASLGVYQDGIAKNIVDDKPKINSHRWFFNAFGPILEPNICILLDVGTRPGNSSIYQLWKAFDRNPLVGGACGEIRAMLGTACCQLLNPLVAAQNFEYKMSNILDKPLESVLGYISVLPGAFSAYRYAALKNDVVGQGPLEKYFIGEDLHNANNTGLSAANMYLAEDRILCFELVAKKQRGWLLQYVNNAFGETDVPNQLPEFISQRRRWLNGSFFAGLYGLRHFPKIWASSHGFNRTLLLTIEGVYTLINLIFSWLAVGNFYIAFYFITKSLTAENVDPFGNNWGTRFFDFFNYLYAFLLFVVFICAMGNRPQGSKFLFMTCLIGFSFIMCYMLFCSSWLIYKGIQLAAERYSWTFDTTTNFQIAMNDPGLRNMVLSLGSTFGIYFVSSCLHRQPYHMFTSFIPYLLLLPGFINILNIYAFCNTHDVSWGTKGDNSVAKDLGVVTVSNKDKGVKTVEVELPAGLRDVDDQYEMANANLLRARNLPHKQPGSGTLTRDDYYRSFRTHLVLSWIASNALLVVFITASEYESIFVPSAGTVYMSILLWVNCALGIFRFIGSLMYLLVGLFTSG
ncbi:glycosyltransferase family 2 protein [Backusella circina FSU 941]|nr:glycosyltransferase family 2 protein [Backusella circina FSU 941]